MLTLGKAWRLTKNRQKWIWAQDELDPAGSWEEWKERRAEPRKPAGSRRLGQGRLPAKDPAALSRQQGTNSPAEVTDKVESSQDKEGAFLRVG